MIVLGHRGARVLARENTCEALQAALDEGAAGSELDVRMTADGALACVHDASLELAGQTLRVCDATRADLESHGVTFLAEALATLAGMIAVVEIKNQPWDACFDPTYAVAIAVAEACDDATVVACFDPITLEHVRRARPSLRTAVITPAAIAPESNLHAALEGGHVICSVEHTAITATFVDAAHAVERLVYAWTTDEPARVRELAEMGVDALMADDPGRAIAALNGGAARGT